MPVGTATDYKVTITVKCPGAGNAKDLAEAIKALQKAGKDASRSMGSGGGAGGGVAKQLEKNAKEAEKAERRRARAMAKDWRDRDKATNANARFDERTRRSAERAAEAARKAAERSSEAQRKAAERTSNAATKAAERAAKAAERAAQRSAAAWEQNARRALAQQKRLADEAVRQAQRAAREAERAANRQARQAEKHARSVQQSNRRTAKTIGSMWSGGGVMAARGFYGFAAGLNWSSIAVAQLGVAIAATNPPLGVFIAAIGALMAVLQLLVGVLGAVGRFIAGVIGAAFSLLKTIVGILAAALQKLVGVLGSVGSGLAKLTVAFLALNAAVLKFASQAWVEFTDAMRNAMAVTGIAGQAMLEMEGLLGRFARTYGPMVGKTATEVAQAYYSLASAGLSVTESLRATPAALALSVATASDISQSTEMLTQTLMTFQLGVEQSERVVNLFAAAIGRTPLTMERLTYALNYVRSSAHLSGLSIEDLTTAVGELSMMGIQGSRIGTGLRRMLMSTINPTPQQIGALRSAGIRPEQMNVKNVGIEGVINQMQKMSDKQMSQFFGMWAIEAANALKILGVEGFEQLKGEISGTNRAFEMQAMQLQTIGGMWRQLKAFLYEAKLQFMEFASPGIIDFMRRAYEALKALSDAGLFRRLGRVVSEVFGTTLGPALVYIKDHAEDIARVIPIFVRRVFAIITTVANAIIRIGYSVWGFLTNLAGTRNIILAFLVVVAIGWNWLAMQINAAIAWIHNMLVSLRVSFAALAVWLANTLPGLIHMFLGSVNIAITNFLATLQQVINAVILAGQIIAGIIVVAGIATGNLIGVAQGAAALIGLIYLQGRFNAAMVGIQNRISNRFGAMHNAVFPFANALSGVSSTLSGLSGAAASGMSGMLPLIDPVNNAVTDLLNNLIAVNTLGLAPGGTQAVEQAAQSASAQQRGPMNIMSIKGYYTKWAEPFWNMVEGWKGALGGFTDRMALRPFAGPGGGMRSNAMMALGALGGFGYGVYPFGMGGVGGLGLTGGRGMGLAGGPQAGFFMGGGPAAPEEQRPNIVINFNAQVNDVGTVGRMVDDAVETGQARISRRARFGENTGGGRPADAYYPLRRR